MSNLHVGMFYCFNLSTIFSQEFKYLTLLLEGEVSQVISMPLTITIVSVR